MSAIAKQAQQKVQRATTAFFLCDIQERFRSMIWNYGHVINTAVKMTSAAKILNIPVVVTEQNPKALGHTVSEIDISNAAICVPKTKFSMCTKEVQEKIQTLGIHTVVIFGIESHVCVTQTAVELLENGYNVVVLADGVSSINRGEIPIALDRLRAAGAIITTSESILFQLLVDAADPQFKQISNLVKENKDVTKTALDELVLGVAKI